MGFTLLKIINNKNLKRDRIMKKIIAILFVATLVSCVGSSTTEEKDVLKTETVTGESLDTGTVDITISEVTTTLTEADSSATE